MTSTILQPTTANGETSNICWETQEKLRFSCIDNIKWKQLWKIIALDTYTNNEATAKRRNHNLRNKSKESLRRSINSNEGTMNVREPAYEYCHNKRSIALHVFISNSNARNSSYNVYSLAVAAINFTISLIASIVGNSSTMLDELNLQLEQN
ncbi:hypothetical protein GQX74_002514 [Glossina fuscipes]|nr:hypothetical protein GQX74_002514 [Glossina fuscipes]